MQKDKDDPESLARQVIQECTDCDQCREFMEDTPCLFFPRLFRLYDYEQEGRKISSAQLRSLVELCNMCGLCSCPNIRMLIRKSKDAFIAREGLKPAIRVLEDVQLVGRVCGAYPRLANLLVQQQPTAGWLKRLAGVHPQRRLPMFPKESFSVWAKKQGLDRKHATTGRKVAYFAGCRHDTSFPR